MAEQFSPPAGLSFNTGNEIGRMGKIIAGLLFIIFTVSAIVALIGFWPDRLPKGDQPANYRREFFNMRLIDSATQYRSIGFSREDSNQLNGIVSRLLDSAALHPQNDNDSASRIKRMADSLRLSSNIYHSRYSLSKADSKQSIIGLNTLLLILVALAGFMGTMIHITSSFTNYVGSEKFKKSWLLWYVVKPFTGAALALVLYFVFRGGLLSFNDSGNINLYGIITLAAFAGLFTDKATMKLAEIFQVIFRTADSTMGKTNERPDKIKSDEVNLKITGIKPAQLLGNSDNKLIISGEGLNNKKLIIKIDDDEIKNPVIKSDSISLTYKMPDDPDKKDFMLQIFDEDGTPVYSSKLSRD